MGKATLYKTLHWFVSFMLLSNSIIPAFYGTPYIPINNTASGQGSSPQALELSNTDSIVITDGDFLPDVTTVTVGTAVTWSNNGALTHQVKEGIPAPTPTPTPTVTLTPTPTVTPPGDEYHVMLPLIISPALANRQGTSATAPAPQATLMPPLSAAAPHATNALWDSGPLQPGDVFTYTFNVPGIYDYFDPLHPEMTGQIIVMLPAHTNETPVITITTPIENAVVSVGNLAVSGTFHDDGEVVEVWVNDVPATLDGDTFSATIPLTGGNQVINVSATDDETAVGFASRVIGVDDYGPTINIHTPKDRQAVYTLTPSIVISTTDFYSSVNPSSFDVTLTDEGGTVTNVTSNLTVTAAGAQGTVATPLAGDHSYTMTVTVADDLGNLSSRSIVFYVPLDPSNVTPPEMAEDPMDNGWVSGIVYNSSTCDEYLTTCQGLAGATATIMKIDPETRVTTPVTGTIFTGPDGFFAFPAWETDYYTIRFEKDGFTYSQREVAIVKGHSTAVANVYLTPMDTAVTPCDDSGCSHQSADGLMQVEIPVGAIPAGSTLDVRATSFDQVEFLPSGELPPGTWETYAFNLSGSSEITFTQPVTVRIQNYQGFDPGTQIPLGYWNQTTLQWEHAGTGVVDATGTWVEMQVTHFSNYDCNDPIAPPEEPDPDTDDKTDDEDDDCKDGAGGCFIELQTGILKEDISLPVVNVQSEEIAPHLLYNTNRAYPVKLIDLSVSLNPGFATTLGNYIGFDLYIAGEASDSFVFDRTSDAGEMGRFRYAWDGRDAMGNLLPPGTYEYAAKFSIPYVAEYCYALDGIFGNPPDCTNGRTGIFIEGVYPVWAWGSVTLNAPADDVFGKGWTLAGLQRLTEDEAGNILITQNDRLFKFYFPRKDLLLVVSDQSTPTESTTTGFLANNLIPSHLYSNMMESDTVIIPPAVSLPSIGDSKVKAEDDNVIEENTIITLIPQDKSPTETTASGIETVDTDIDSLDETLLPAAIATTEVGGVIDIDSTWTITNSPYILTSDVTIAAGVTLTVTPGVMVMGNSSTKIQIEGHLVAVGTSTQPIIFTSVTNTGSYQWEGLDFNGGTGNLQHVTVRYAGRSDGTARSNITVHDMVSGTVSISDSVIANSSYHGMYVRDGQVIISNTQFTDNYSEYYTSLTVTGSSSVVTATNVTIQNGYGVGAGATVADNAHLIVNDSTISGTGYGLDNAGGYLTVNGGTVSSNTYPLRASIMSLQDIQVIGSDWSGNTYNNLILGSGHLTESMVLPLSVNVQPDLSPSAYHLGGTLTVDAGSVLTIAPGTAIMGNTSGVIRVEGYLEAVGTPTQPITFTSATDTGSGLSDLWQGLDFNGGNGNLQHVTVRYAGTGSGGVYANIAVRNMVSGTVSIADSVIAHTYAGHGLYVSEGQVVISNTQFVDSGTSRSYNAVYAGGSSSVVTATNISIQGLGGAEVANNAHLTINNSTISGCRYALSNDHGYLTVNGGTVSGNTYPLRASVMSLQDIQAIGSDWSGNTHNNLLLERGHLTESMALLSPANVQPDLSPSTYHLGETLTVDAGSVLTITSGMAIVGEDGYQSFYPPEITVNGHLAAVGTAAQPISFTSGVKFNFAGSAELQYVTVDDTDDALAAILLYNSGQVVINNSTISGSAHGVYLSSYSGEVILQNNTISNNEIGIYVSRQAGIAPLVVTNNSIKDNTNYGVFVQEAYNPEDTVTRDFRYSWWGSSSGPYHPESNPTGWGNPVSDHALFDPWLGAEFVDTGTVVKGTATDNSQLIYDPDSDSYSRHYLNGTMVQFDSNGRHAYTEDRHGNRTDYIYNDDDTVASMTFTPAGATSPSYVWSFTYDGNGKLASITDPANRSTSFTVDANNQLRNVIFPDGSDRHFYYDERGLLTQQQDENGDINSYTYDAYGRIRSETFPERAIYDPLTNSVVITHEVHTFVPSDTGYQLLNGSAVGTPADPAPLPPLSDGLVDIVYYGRGERSGHTNKWGQFIDETDGLGRTITSTYDTQNNLIRRVYPDGDCAEYSYDQLSNVLSSSQMPAAQCSLDPANRDPAQVQTWLYTYEYQFNQLKSATDPLGYTTTYVYDYEEDLGEVGNLIRVEYPPVPDETGTVFTPTVQYSYTVWGGLETMTDPRGTVTRYEYSQGTPDEASDGANPLFAPGVTPVPGLLTAIIDDFGGENLTTTYRQFDAVGHPGLRVAPGGQMSTTFSYDLGNRLLSRTNAQGIVTSYTYDAIGNLTGETWDDTADDSGRNVLSGYHYDAYDRLLEAYTNEDGVLLDKAEYAYDVNSKLGRIQDGLGNETRYLYDDADQLINVIDAAGQVITNTYTLDGLLETVTDADGYLTRFSYNGLSRLTSIVRDENGLNLGMTFTYDLNNNVKTITDANGRMTCFSYDSHNRLTTQTDDCTGLALTSQYQYDRNGNLARTTDWRGVVTRISYDALNRAQQTTADENGLHLSTTYAYNPAGLLSTITDHRDVVSSYSYDSLNRLQSQCNDVSGLNLCTEYGYNSLNYRTVITDDNGIVTQAEVNPFGQPLAVTADVGGENAITRYSYDTALNLAWLTDANGNNTHYSYTPRNELETALYADGTSVSYGYDGRGYPAHTTLQDGAVITSTYDGVGRLTTADFSTGGGRSYQYDAAGRMTTAAETANDHSSLLTFGYDALGSVVSSTQQLDGGTVWPVDYTYDYPGGVSTTFSPSGLDQIRQIDALGRLDNVSSSSAGVVADYSYDDFNNFTTISHPNGVTDRFDYDALYRVTQVSSPVADYRYTYDNVGNRTSMQRAHKAGQPTDIYQYDGLYQLTDVWYGADAVTPEAITTYDSYQNYDLDNLGNRLTFDDDGSSHSYGPNDGSQLTNPMNRYETVDAAPFSYDLRGNTLNDGTSSYNYDILNRQTAMNGPGGSAEYIYDALGRRIAKEVDGTLTHYVYDASYRVLEERDDSGTLLARYTYGAGVDEPLTMERDDSSYTYHRDALGNITEVTDESGALVERYEYDVYGQPQFFDGSYNPIAETAIGNPYLFTGRRYDPESGNYYYRARQYSPTLGRFLQTDPLGYAAGDANLYRYVGNNPTYLADPSGLDPEADAFARYIVGRAGAATYGGASAMYNDLNDNAITHVQDAVSDAVEGTIDNATGIDGAGKMATGAADVATAAKGLGATYWTASLMTASLVGEAGVSAALGTALGALILAAPSFFGGYLLGHGFNSIWEGIFGISPGSSFYDFVEWQISFSKDLYDFWDWLFTDDGSGGSGGEPNPCAGEENPTGPEPDLFQSIFGPYFGNGNYLFSL